eukprot:TRINITY_DN37002_c0_g1_i1.p1 TRINITY_DN37002_c0_g1~~TRINITY_DN37002_c0_g1_i1.p1  ORF type:complete len:532 (-),score=119.86 TRINITY_DN37002_c0_g1_i1:10-1605(-)
MLTPDCSSSCAPPLDQQSLDRTHFCELGEYPREAAAADGSLRALCRRHEPDELPSPRYVSIDDDGDGSAGARVIGVAARCAARGASSAAAAVAERQSPAAVAAAAKAATGWFGGPLTRARLAIVVLGCLCLATAVHSFLNLTEASVLQAEVARLRVRNEALEEHARIRDEEQRDLASLILDPSKRGRLANMMQRSRAFGRFVRYAGFASNPGNTEAVRECLGRMVSELEIKSMLDIPSEDGSWQHLIPGIDKVTYVGADINPAALEAAKNRTINQQLGMNFMLFDAVHFPLRRSFDLILFRDTAEQQRVQDTLQTILNFKRSGSTYLAASYWPDSPAEANEAAIHLDHAGWYEPNLLLEPFGFPDPLISCENKDAQSRFRGRSKLGVWRLRDLQVHATDVLRANPRRHEGFSTAHHPMLSQLHRIVVPRSGLAQLSENERPLQVRRKGGDDDLQDILNFFGSALARGRPQVQRTPFDGLLGDFLETSGSARRGDGRKRDGFAMASPLQSRLASQLFGGPSFEPEAEGGGAG